MNLCLFISGSPEVKELLAITIPNKWEYCTRHGYSLHYHEQGCLDGKKFWEKGGGPGGVRMECMNAVLKTGLYDWILQMDSDTLITNMTVPAESFVDSNFDLIIATDSHGLQVGVFLIKNSPRSIAIIDEVMTHRNKWLGPCVEQTTLEILLEKPEYKGMAKIVPQRTFNSYQTTLYGLFTDRLGTSSQWLPGDFAFHVPGFPVAQKLPVLRSIVPQIKR